MYCGDETGAFIGDVGSHTARFGYGGEDCPKVVVPSAAYHISSHSSSTTAVTGSDDGRGIINSSTLVNKGRGKYSAPVSLMRIPPETFEDNDGFVPIYSSLNSNDNQQQQQQNSNIISNNDGLIQDIDAWASLWEYSYSALCVRGKGKHTRGHKYHHHQSELPELQPEGEGLSQTISSQSNNIDGPTIDHPLLAVDSTSRTNIPSAVQEKQRAQMLETLFESLSAPAAYIAPSAMLSSFAYGRQTSLVVDIGHSGSRVTPIVDGYCLTSGSVSSERGGRWLGNVQQSVLEGEFKNVNGTVVNKWNGWGDSSSSGSPPCRDGGIIPRYALHSNTKKCSKNKLQLLKESSFHSMAVHEVMYEMMSSSHIVPLENSKEESPPFCGYGDDGESMVVENSNNDDIVMEEVKKEEDEDEDDIDEGPCYVLPDSTRVDLAKSKAGKDLCRLPVSHMLHYIYSLFFCPKQYLIFTP